MAHGFMRAALALAALALVSLPPCTFLHIAPQAASTLALGRCFLILSVPRFPLSRCCLPLHAYALACSVRRVFLAWILLKGMGLLPRSAPALPARCEALLIASDRGTGAMRVFADCQPGRHMSYNAPADSCAWVICQCVLHRGGGHRHRSPVVEQTMLAKNCVSTQNRRHGRKQ